MRHLSPQSGHEQGVIGLPLPARVFYGLGATPEAVTKIDHSLRASMAVAERCRARSLCCADVQRLPRTMLLGGKIASALPDWPAAAHLSFARATEPQFLSTNPTRSAAAAGLALQGTLSNVAVDVLVLVFRSYKSGDAIRVEELALLAPPAAAANEPVDGNGVLRLRAEPGPRAMGGAPARGKAA